MAVLHKAGKAKRAQALAYAPMYMIFSSYAGNDVDETLDLSRNDIKASILGARKVSRQVLIRPFKTGEAAAPSDITVSGTAYKVANAADLPTLIADGVKLVLAETLLSSAVVPANSAVKTIILASYVEGVVPSGKDVLTAAELNAAQVRFVAEAVHKVVAATGIVVDANLNKPLQLVLEM